MTTRKYGVLGSYFFTDTGTHKVGFDSPHLNNIYDSAPYLHNGVGAYARGDLDHVQHGRQARLLSRHDT